MRLHQYLSAPPVAIAHRGGYLSDSSERTSGVSGDEPTSSTDSTVNAERTASVSEVELAQRQENTMAAFRGAVDLGYRYLETDAHTTSDGTLIAFHDDRLDRVTDSTGIIRELRHAQLGEARIGGEYPIPTMEELLTAFDEAPGPVRYNVDLKSNDSVRPMLRLVAQLGIGPRVCVASFSSPRLWVFRALSRLHPRSRRAATSAGPIGVAALRLLPDVLARWVHSPGIAYQVPVTSRVLGREIRVVTPGFVRRAHAAGKQVHVWTINTESEMHELLDLGVDGIVTDRIDVLQRVLAERASGAT